MNKPYFPCEFMSWDKVMLSVDRLFIKKRHFQGSTKLHNIHLFEMRANVHNQVYVDKLKSHVETFVNKSILRIKTIFWTLYFNDNLCIDKMIPVFKEKRAILHAILI